MDTEEGERGTVLSLRPWRKETATNQGLQAAPETEKGKGWIFSRRLQKGTQPDSIDVARKPITQTSPEPRDKRCCFKPLRQWLCCYSSSKELPESLHPEVICFPPSRGTLRPPGKGGISPTVDALQVRAEWRCLSGHRAPSRTFHWEETSSGLGRRGGQEGEASIPEQPEGPALLGARQGSLLSF